METKRTHGPEMVNIETEKDLEALLDKNRFTAKEISAVKKFCTEEMRVSENIKVRMSSSATFVISLIKNSKTLSVEECKIVFGLYRTTQNEAVKKAIESELVTQNTGIAAKIASNASNICRIEYDDLLQESLFHLFEAVRKYDTAYDAKFSTFAFKHIKTSLNRYIENTQSLMKVPNERQRKYRTFCAFEKQYIMTHPNASHEQIAEAAMEEFGFSNNDIAGFATIRKYASPEYMDMDIWDSGEQIKDYIRDKGAEARFDEMLDEYFREEFLGFLKDALPPKQYKVMVEYYGLDGSEAKTFREIDEERDNLKGRPGPAAALKHKKAIARLKNKYKGQLKQFASGIGYTIN